MSLEQAQSLLDEETALISRRAFFDEKVYALELERIFRRCWLFVGHDSMIPKPGDFLANYMGEDPVILWRGDDGRARVLLNTCPHRGNKLCLYDRGNARSLTCSYHGWTFSDAGALIGVPFDQASYEGRLDRAQNGLREATVATYGGLIFAAWEPVESLEAHLGELRWWLDAFVCHQDFGGLAYLPSAEKYRMPGNWKLTADNFVGDNYHVPMTHASALRFRPGQSQRQAQTEDAAMRQGYVSRRRTASYSFLLAPGHGIGAVTFDESRLERDLAIAKTIGSEAVDYVNERHAKLMARVKSVSKPEGFVFGTCFPNLTFQGHGAFEGELLALAQPRGSRLSEIWQWLFVERDAPASVKRRVARDTSQRQSAAGLIGQDDGENFERIEESSRGIVALGMSFNYAMAKERDDNQLDNGGAPREGWPVEGVVGEPSRSAFSETNQREYYRRWAQLMALEGAPV